MNELRWPDLKVGTAAGFEVMITPTLMDNFAAVSGDYNPLHMDSVFAATCGFPTRVAFGMLTASFYSQLVGMYLPGKYALLHGIDLEFKSPAFSGDRLTVSGEIVYLNEAYRRLDLKARTVNQNARTISKAVIRVGLNDS